jgi:hypothetical protein
MTATADIFTPIHKAIRSMIYSLGGQLQTIDFADRAATETLLAQVKVDFGSALGSNCVLCLLHHHAGSEEWGLFGEASRFEPALITTALTEHHELEKRLMAISASSADLLAVDEPGPRLVRGVALTREVNDFMARYLTHMNWEETTLVPAMQKHFTNEQMFGMRAAIEKHMPRERFAAYLRWMLPSLNVAELTEMFAGAKQSAPPEMAQILTGIAESMVDPSRWKAVTDALRS